MVLPALLEGGKVADELRHVVLGDIVSVPVAPGDDDFLAIPDGASIAGKNERDLQ